MNASLRNYLVPVSLQDKIEHRSISLSPLWFIVNSCLGWWICGCGPLSDFTEWVKQCCVQKKQRSQAATLQSTTVLLQGVLLSLTLH